MSSFELYQGDCLEIMPKLADKSIDMILCDLPRGTTACKWDSVIPFEPLWEQYERIIKDNGAIVLFGSQPFTSVLVMSNLEWFKYCMIWEKTRMTNFLNAPRQPLRNFEDIVVFINGASWYNPIGVLSCDFTVNRGERGGWTGDCYGDAAPIYKQTTTNYPNSIIRVSSETDVAHPTQKPVALCEYLILTYTNEGDLVLDNCMGSGTTGVACYNTNRRFIGIEKDPEYFRIAKRRIEKARSQLRISF